MFEKLGRRTQQLADSVTDRVDNLIKEHDKILEQNRKLKNTVKFLLRSYEGLLSCPEIKSIMDKALEEQNEHITKFMLAYDTSKE